MNLSTRKMSQPVPQTATIRRKTDPNEMIEVNKKKCECTFKFCAKGAKRVFLSGDFNDWNEQSHPMEKIGEFWKLTLPLPAGEYRFKYLVDGFWHNDLDAHKYVPNVWGSDDSVVVVPKPPAGTETVT
jgi:1,4-alpha-glucan branching enzyme